MRSTGCLTKFSQRNTGPFCQMKRHRGRDRKDPTTVGDATKIKMTCAKPFASCQKRTRLSTGVIRIPFAQLTREAVCFFGIASLPKRDRGFVQRARSNSWIVI